MFIDRSSRRSVRAVAVVIGLALICASGCARVAATAKARQDNQEWSGFLDDYSQLRLGEQGDLAFVYRSPTAKWTAYDKVLVEPVTLWRSGKDSLAPIAEGDLLRLVAHFERAVRTRLGAGFKLVTEPSAGTLRLRLAITAAHAKDPIVDVLTATPERKGPKAAKGNLSPELAAFIENAMIEGEIRDAVSGELLAQGIDRRQAGAPPRLPTWEALDRALAFWADRACSRLEARTHSR